MIQFSSVQFSIFLFHFIRCIESVCITYDVCTLDSNYHPFPHSHPLCVGFLFHKFSNFIPPPPHHAFRGAVMLTLSIPIFLAALAISAVAAYAIIVHVWALITRRCEGRFWL